MKLNKAFLKAVYDVMVLISISSLFNSVMTFGKNEFLKYSVLQFKNGTFVLFVVSKKRLTDWIRLLRYFGNFKL